MATEVICIVDTDGTQSPHYTSLNAAIVGESGATPAVVTGADLVANDQQLTIECRATSGVAEESFVASFIQVDGFVTDEQCHVKIWTDPAGYNRHAGVWNDNIYRLIITCRHSILFQGNTAHVHVYGMQMEVAHAEQPGSDTAIAVTQTGWHIAENIIRRTNTLDGTGTHFLSVPTGGDIYIWNNLFIGWTYPLSCNHRWDAVSIIGAVYNNTASQGSIFIRFNAGNGAGFAIVNNISAEYIIANLGVESNNVLAENVVFENAVNGIYRLGPSDTVALNQGADLSANGIFAFESDIIGTARPQGTAWDIGAFEYVASGGTTRNLIASILGASTTPDTAASILRSILADIAGTSVTPDISATVAAIIELLASVEASSTTPDVQARLMRGLSAGINAISSTPDVTAAIVRSLVAALSAESATPEVNAAILRALSAALIGASATPDAAVTMLRSISAALLGESVTPNIAISIAGIVSFVASLSGTSTTPDVAATTQRLMATGILGQSSTPDAVINALRALTADITGASVTPDIVATLTNMVSFSASLVGASVTPDIAATIARALEAVVVGESITPEAQATTARELLAAIEGSSTTPDDLMLIMYGLGQIIDPDITSLTTARSITSLTVQRTIEEI